MSKPIVTAGILTALVIGATGGYIAASQNDIQEARQDLADVRKDAATVFAPPSGPTPTAKRPTDTTIPGDGIWKVGVDIQAGEYKVDASGWDCYWERLSGTSGEFDHLITNGNGGGPIVITIAPTDVAFSTRRCGEWTRIS